MQFTRILAIRHGETTWNQDKRIQGHIDIPLNERGLWQAERAAQALLEEDVAAIYSSDLQRAFQTAQAIGTATQVAVVPHTGLRERCFGQFEGRTWQELEHECPEVALAWRQRVPDFIPKGGESLQQLQSRIQSVLNDLAARHIGEQIVVVAHGGVLDILYRWATQTDLQAPRSWTVENATINRLLWTPENLSLVAWADSRHLDIPTEDDATV